MKKTVLFILVAMLVCSTVCNDFTYAQEIIEDPIIDNGQETKEISDDSEEEIVQSDVLESNTTYNDVFEDVDEEEIIDEEEWWTQKNTYFDFSDNRYYGSANPMPAPYCTWYVWGRVKQMTGISLSGYVDQWYKSAYGGVGMVDTPSTYAIMMAYKGNSFAHAAFVEYWDGEYIKISETNNAISTDVHQYYEYYGTFDQYIAHGQQYNGWTTIKFIPLVNEADLGMWIEENGYWYYLDKNEEKIENKWLKIKGRWYYFEEDGKMRTGLHCINGNWYLFGSYGMQTGWQEVDNTFYYFYPLEGKMEGVAVNEWQKINNKWYYFDDYKMQLWYFEVDGVPYHTTDNGDLFTGWKIVNDNWYYFTEYGAIKGWKKLSNKWYYFEDYKMMTGKYEVDGIPFFSDNNGALSTGWKKVNDIWYYFTSNGAINGWKKLSNKWYYFDAYKMVTDFKNIGGNRYYFDENGKMVTGWKEINGLWYYFYSSGAMAKDTYIGSYYINVDGIWIDE